MKIINKWKGLLIGLFTATLAFACVALTPKTAPAPVSAETTVCVDKVTTIQDGVSGNRDLVTLVFDNPITDLTAQNRNASFTSSTTTETWVDYVKINGKTIRQSIAGYAWAHDNVYWCTNNEQIKMSFSSHDNSTVALKYDGTDIIEILAGFTGQNGAVTTEDVKFSNASGSWQRAYDEEDISESIYLSAVYGDANVQGVNVGNKDGWRFDFVTSHIWDTTDAGKWMGNNNNYLYDYVTVNGKTVKWISNNVDDSEYTYTQFPASMGGGWAVPVYMQAFNRGTNQNLFCVYVHDNYLQSLLETDGKITIGVSEGFYTLKGATRYVAKSDVEMDVIAQSASVTLSDGLEFNYKIKLPALNLKDVTYETVFSFRGETVVAEMSHEEDGKKVYVFDGVTPEYMNEALTVTCKAKDIVGRVFAWNTTTISVQEYCETLYATASGELKTLLVDVLNYGAAAQQYKGITENLVNANVDQQYATATAPTASDNVLAASQGDDVKFNAAVLTLEDKVTVTAKFTASNVDGLTATVQLGNNTAVAADIVALGNGVYGIVFADVAATQYDEAIVFTVSDTNGVVAKCRYSVNTYAQRTWDDATAGALAKALWAYGVSASAYAALV